MSLEDGRNNRNKGWRTRPPPPRGGGGVSSLPLYILGSGAMVAGGVTYCGAFYYYSHGLEVVPLTKRKRFIAASPSWERRMGDE